MSKVNIKQIATAAGVCQATVSRTLSDPTIVSERTRAKVMKVVESLGYTPNRLGASLRNGRSNSVVVTLPDITNPYFSPIIRENERIALDRGYSVLLGDTLDDPALAKKFANMVKTKQADGIIINSQVLPFDFDPKTQEISSLPPIVSISETVGIEGIHTVSIDNYEVGKLATQHLIDLGHTNIVAIAGPIHLNTVIERTKGFKAALKAANISFCEDMILYGNYSADSGVELTAEFLKRKNRPTAIFSFGDMVSIGVLHTLREFDYCVPEDISVISIDGTYLGKYTAPPLTTVAQPMNLIGKKSMEVLLDLIEDKKPEGVNIIVPHELIIRKSTGPVPK
jgi:LacI family repressor for deo operon, udp, cdd, tsx, nupC, and nupG